MKLVADNIMIGDTQVNAVYLGDTMIWEKVKGIIFTNVGNDGELSIQRVGSASTAVISAVSEGGAVLSDDLTQTPVTVKNGDVIYVRASAPIIGNTVNDYFQFVTTGDAMFDLSGKMSWFNGKEVYGYSFYRLFEDTKIGDCRNLLLDYSSIKAYSYSRMFFGSTITYGPVCNDVTHSTHSCTGMFGNCSQLVVAPQFASLSTMGFWSMATCFEGCSAMTTGPICQPTTLANYAFNYAFNGCVNMTKAMPTLPAKVLTEACYRGMFQDCQNLTKSPVIDASQTEEMPSNALYYMFARCYRLSEVTIKYAGTWSTTNAHYWMYNVASTGVMSYPDSLVLPTGVNGIPSGWTKKTKDPYWSAIGYDEAPPYQPVTMTDAQYNYATNLYNNWSPEATSMPAMDNTQLVYMPKVDMSNITSLRNAFKGFTNLRYVPALNTSKCLDFTQAFREIGNGLQRIEELDFSGAASCAEMTSYTDNCHYMLIKNIGKMREFTNFGVSVGRWARAWGENTEEHPDALQSMVDTLLTYSFDRAAAGYPVCTIWFFKENLARLTDEQKAAIQAKGYKFDAA